MILSAPRPIVQKLGFQIAFLLAMVLLPLTLISMVNSFRASSETRARSEAALTGETLQAAGHVVQQIEEARGSAAALASLIGPLIGDDTACSAAMARMAALQPQYSLVAFIPKDGMMRCSSSGKPHDFSQSTRLRDLIADPRPSFSVNQNASISGTSVLGVSHPVFDAGGAILGIVSLSLPHSKFDIMSSSTNPIGPLEFMTFDRGGTVLVSTDGLDTAKQLLPNDRSLVSVTADHPMAFSAISVAGDTRVFSVVPVVPGELYVLGTWPADAAKGIDDTLISIPFLASVLICAGSLIVAWLSVEHLVNRHIRKLNTAIRSFSSGNRTMTDLNVKGAPLEIREIATAYEQMTDAVMRDEAELENAVHQKEVLLREVHHRVKNNLQMIASIMNMHMRKARTDETKAVIRGLQGRVMSLATIHRELYQTTGVTDIHASELMGAIARQAVNVAANPERRFDLRITVADIRMTPDQAIPLALLAGEALMNAVKYASSDASGTGILDLRLKHTATDSAVLEIACETLPDTVRANESVDDGAALSTQLMSAFAMQLGGTLDDSVSDGTYQLSVRFKLRPLVEAEARHIANTEQES